MAFVDDQDPVEQFAAQGSNHPFADRGRPGRCGWIGADLNAVGGEDRVERPGKPGISVSEQERDGGGAVGEVHEQVAGGLGGPRTGRCAVTPSRCARRELCSTAIRA